MKVNIGKYKKNGKDRTVKVQIDPYDIWSLDHTLALIIAPALRLMKEDKTGIPGVDISDLPERFHATGENDMYPPEGIIYSADGWAWILDQMIAAMEYSEQEIEHRILADELRVVQNEHGELVLVENKGDNIKYRSKMFDKTATDDDTQLTYNMYHMIARYETETVRRGNTLFGKYFRALWT